MRASDVRKAWPATLTFRSNFQQAVQRELGRNKSDYQFDLWRREQLNQITNFDLSLLGDDKEWLAEGGIL